MLYRTEEDFEKLRVKVIEGTLMTFHEKGYKFTMDDIASKLSISKKTIYRVYPDKETLFLAVVDYAYGYINKGKAEVLADDSLSTTKKLEKLLSVLPENFNALDLSFISEAKDKFPSVYKKIEYNIENNWDDTISLINKGIEEGSFRKISIPLFKHMYETAVEGILTGDYLKENKTTYAEALKDVTDILLMGILA